jgi:5-(carboxyamino)imidazole ribonucleotide synthase
MKAARVGILGGGQLGQMLSEAALKLNLTPVVFCSQRDEPALLVAQERFLGDPKDDDIFQRFRASVDIVAIESEFFPFPKSLGDSNLGAPLIPSLQTVTLLSDKLQQKELWRRHGLPTAPFVALRSGQDISDWLYSLDKHFPSGFVIKTAKNGYDGKGVFVCERGSPEALRFCLEAQKKGGDLYAEQKIQFKRELAIIGCRSINGEFISYPLVISEQKGGVCHLVTGPACELGVPKETALQAKKLAKNISEISDLCGSFGVEFFETASGEILINEIAPRVHNSGHYSQDACEASQFENHWRAIMGMPLGKVDSKGFFMMLNLLGPSGIYCNNSLEAQPKVSNQMNLHWYNKSEIKPGRKLGHINGVASNKSELDHLVTCAKTIEAAWISALSEISLRNKYKKD